MKKDCPSEPPRPPPWFSLLSVCVGMANSLLTQAAAYYDLAAAVSCVKTKGEYHGNNS